MGFSKLSAVKPQHKVIGAVSSANKNVSNSEGSWAPGSGLFVGQRKCKKLAIAVALSAFPLSVPSTGFALGLGGVETKSYIGQPLRVDIPLYNVESPNSLKIELERVNGDPVDGVFAELSRANSQLSIVIRSEEVVNEPYYNFSLNLTDGGNTFRKQFSVLLDLSPTQAVLSQSVAGNNSSIKSAVEPSKGSGNQAVAVVSASSGSVMGPYDWAKAGQIPERFGAVLDGQSLWRVARRISPAMNVTNNQMMWALYNANPKAFATNSIESLRAGSFLTIPSTVSVASISDAQAKELLKSLVRQPVNVAESSATVPTTSQAATVANISKDERLTTAASDSSFQLTGVDQQVDADGQLVGASDAESKQIIVSLSETISSMTAQLSEKDKKIAVLESQVNELKAFIQQDEAMSTPLVAQEQGGQKAVGVDLSDPAAQVITLNQESVLQTDSPDEANASFFASKWSWLLALLGLLTVGLIVMRKRLSRLWQSLNFGGAKDQVEFQPTMVVANERSFSEMQSKAELNLPEPIISSEPENNIEIYSEVTFDDYDDFFVDETTPEEELDFEQRIARVIADGDLEFAHQLLEIAHGHDVDEERYHFYRLKLLALKYDEDAFYDYYYSIEDDIPAFTKLVQTDISKLVVQLARH